MKILLDTQILLWLQASPHKLGADVLSLLREPRNSLLLSAASSWEIAIKYGLGKLSLPETPDAYVPERMRRSGVDGLAVDHAHALHVATLPQHHRDRFDRLLIAQAQLEGLTILTADPAFEPYDVEVRCAG